MSDEIAGYHLERAARYRLELDPADVPAAVLANRAAERLGRAGRRAFARSDMPAAANLLRRATALWEPGRERAEALSVLGEALSATGDLTKAREVLDLAVEAGRALGDVGLQGRAEAERMDLMLMTESGVGADVARREGERLLAMLEGTGDDLALAKTWYLLGTACLYAGRYRDMEHAMRRSLEHAERSGDRRRRATAIQWLAVATVGCPIPVEEAIARLEELQRHEEDGSEASGGILVNLGVLHSMAGRIDLARTLAGRGREASDSSGWRSCATSTRWRPA